MARAGTSPPPAAAFPWAYTFHLAIANFGVALIGPTYAAYVPILLAGLGLNATLIGFLSSLDSYGSLLVLPVVAALSDRTYTRLGRRAPFMLVAAPAVAVAFGLLPHARTLPLVILALVATVAGMAAVRGPTIALLGDFFPSTWRDRASGVTNLMGGLAWVLAFVAGGILYGRDSTLPFLVTGVAMLLCVSFVALTVRRPPAALAAAAAADGPAAAGTALAKLHVGTVLRRIVTGHDRRLLAILGALLAWVAGSLAVGNFFTLYSREILHISPGAATELLGLYALTGVVCAVPVGLLTRRFGRRLLLAAGFAGQFVLFVAGYSVQDAWAMGLILALGGVAATAASVNTLPLVLESAPPGAIGTYTSLTYIFGALGGLLGPVLAGQLVDLTGSYRAIFLFGPVAMGLAFVLILTVRDR